MLIALGDGGVFGIGGKGAGVGLGLTTGCGFGGVGVGSLGAATIGSGVGGNIIAVMVSGNLGGSGRTTPAASA
ncbi:hypothetical protein GCM10027296_11420 [Chitinimonas naiadis]